MRKKALMTALMVAALAAAIASAQPPGFAEYPGERGPRHERWQGDRLDRMVEYLELSDAQATQWQAITEKHREAARVQWQRVGDLREEFEALADQDNPDLQQVGQLALDLHSEMKSARSSRGQAFTELEEILTPEQQERLEALKTAREFSGRRAHRGERSRFNPPDSK